MVGLIPLCAVAVIPRETLERFPRLRARAREDYERYADLLGGAANPMVPGVEGRHLLSVLDESKLRRVLSRMLDEERFLSPHGIRSLSRSHLDEPFVFTVHGQEYRVQYLPAESDTAMFGGNSNWRGPVWFPINLLIVRALLTYYLYYGDDFTIECPTGSGQHMTLYQVAKEISDRLISIFRRDEAGRRPVYGGMATFQDDPHWRDLLLFHEYFHGDNGAGIGASHQTGWTGAVARLIQLFGSTGPAECLYGPPLPLAHAYQPPGASPAAATAAPGPTGDGARPACTHRRLTAATVTRFRVVAAVTPFRGGRRVARAAGRPPGAGHERPEARHDRCRVKRSRDDVLPARTGPGRPRRHARAGWYRAGFRADRGGSARAPIRRPIDLLRCLLAVLGIVVTVAIGLLAGATARGVQIDAVGASSRLRIRCWRCWGSRRPWRCCSGRRRSPSASLAAGSPGGSPRRC